MASRRFSANESTIYRDLKSTLRRMGATSLRVGQDFQTGEYEIVFDRAGKRYVFRCNRWKHPLDNLRAAQRSISLLFQALEEYGTTSSEQDLRRPQADPFEQFFAGFEALPDDTVLMLGTGRAAWWDVLGVSQSASRAEVISAFRSLARVHHPDAGGHADDFKRVRAAYDAGLKATGG